MTIDFLVLEGDTWGRRVDQILNEVPKYIKVGENLSIRKVLIKESKDIIYERDGNTDEKRCIVMHPYGFRNRPDILDKIKCPWIVLLSGGSPEYAKKEGDYFLENDHYTVICGSSVPQRSYIPEWLSYLNEREMTKEVFEKSQYVLRYGKNKTQKEINDLLTSLDMVEQAINAEKDSEKLDSENTTATLREGIEVSLDFMRKKGMDQKFYEKVKENNQNEANKGLKDLFAHKEEGVYIKKIKDLEYEDRDYEIKEMILASLELLKEFLTRKKVELK